MTNKLNFPWVPLLLILFSWAKSQDQDAKFYFLIRNYLQFAQESHKFEEKSLENLGQELEILSPCELIDLWSARGYTHDPDFPPEALELNRHCNESTTPNQNLSPHKNSDIQIKTNWWQDGTNSESFGPGIRKAQLSILSNYYEAQWYQEYLDDPSTLKAKLLTQHENLSFGMYIGYQQKYFAFPGLNEPPILKNHKPKTSATILNSPWNIWGSWENNFLQFEPRFIFKNSPDPNSSQESNLSLSHHLKLNAFHLFTHHYLHNYILESHQQVLGQQYRIDFPNSKFPEFGFATSYLPEQKWNGGMIFFASPQKQSTLQWEFYQTSPHFIHPRLTTPLGYIIEDSVFIMGDLGALGSLKIDWKEGSKNKNKLENEANFKHSASLISQWVVDSTHIAYQYQYQWEWKGIGQTLGFQQSHFRTIYIKNQIQKKIFDRFLLKENFQIKIQERDTHWRFPHQFTFEDRQWPFFIELSQSDWVHSPLIWSTTLGTHTKLGKPGKVEFLFNLRKNKEKITGDYRLHWAFIF